MDSSSVTEVIYQVLKQIQTNSGLICPPLNNAIKPLKDLKKFDSPTSLAATGMIARKLNLKIEPKVNLFGDNKGTYTIAQSVAMILKIAQTKNKQPASA